MVGRRQVRTERVEHAEAEIGGDEGGDERAGVGEVADTVGLSLRTIRYYEEVELVAPSGRSAGGFRLYTDDDVERLRLVKDMKPLDFTIEEMRDLLELRDRLAIATRARRDDVDRLRLYAEAALRRCEALRAQLTIAESFARTLQREAARARRRAST